MIHRDRLPKDLELLTRSLAMVGAHVEKWLSFYSRGFTPWDSHAPCSQLVAGFSFDQGVLGGAADCRRESDDESCDVPEDTTQYPSAAGPGPSIERMLAEMDAAINKFESEIDESATKIERLDGEIKIACRTVAGTVYDAFCAGIPARDVPSTDLARTVQEVAAKAQKTFEESLGDVHDSLRVMYTEQLSERLSAMQKELVDVLAIRHAEIIDREQRRRAEWEERKEAMARDKLGPHLIVGTSGLKEWHCLELGCGSGATAVWLAEHGSGVVGVDVCEAPLREARARAVALGVARRCIFLHDDVFDLALFSTCGQTAESVQPTRQLSFPLAEKMQMRYEAGEIPAQEVKDVVQHTSASQKNQEDYHLDVTRALQLDSVLRSGPSAAGPGAGDALRTPSQGGAFDLIVDIQCFHVLRCVDLPKLTRVVKENLRCGGLYFVMTGNDKEPDVGPSVVSKREVLAPWIEFCDVEAIFATRFDSTSHYNMLPRPPLAWCALFRRRVELQASAWQSLEEGWRALLQALGSPLNHLHSIDALVDSLLTDSNAVRRPVTIRFLFATPSTGVLGGRVQVRRWAERLRDTFDQLMLDGAFRDSRRVRFMLD